jgi:hypothetical protein
MTCKLYCDMRASLLLNDKMAVQTFPLELLTPNLSSGAWY